VNRCSFQEEWGLAGYRKTIVAFKKLDGLLVMGTREFQQDAQKGCPARPQPMEAPEA
jgi:hypothetical protein